MTQSQEPANMFNMDQNVINTMLSRKIHSKTIAGFSFKIRSKNKLPSMKDESEIQEIKKDSENVVTLTIKHSVLLEAKLT